MKRNYIFAYCESRERYVNCRLFKTHAIIVLRNSLWEHYDLSYVREIRANFDAFLSFGHYIKVRLDSIGGDL